MAYLREARYYNQGAYGLLQLGAVYNVNLELFGNTIFYPGMEVYIDPRGFGGNDWDPSTFGTTANALGIGGYHTVTKVTNTISAGGFKTTLEALYQYSGDPRTKSQAIDGYTLNKRKAAKLKDKKPPKKDGKCTRVLEESARREQQIRVKNKGKKVRGKDKARR